MEIGSKPYDSGLILSGLKELMLGLAGKSCRKGAADQGVNFVRRIFGTSDAHVLVDGDGMV